MFDLRYHVASLVAVFLALIIGILVGVGLSGSGVTKNADLKVARAQIDDLNSKNTNLETQVTELQKTQNAFSIVYPAVMRDLLTDKRIAILYVGPKDQSIEQAIERTLDDANAPPPVRIVSLKVPIDAQRLDTILFAKGAQFTRYVGADKLSALGAALGTEFEAGGQTQLWKLLGNQLIAERTGNVRQRVDGVIVVRTVKPQPGDTARFLHGVMTGLAGGNMPAVGVEKSGSNPSAVSPGSDFPSPYFGIPPVAIS